MRADLPVVERAEELVDAGIDRVDLGGAQQSAGDAGLVGDHADAQATGAQPVQRGLGAGHRYHGIGIAVVGNVPDEGPVPVEQNRLGQPSR